MSLSTEIIKPQSVVIWIFKRVSSSILSQFAIFRFNLPPKVDHSFASSRNSTVDEHQQSEICSEYKKVALLFDGIQNAIYPFRVCGDRGTKST